MSAGMGKPTHHGKIWGNSHLILQLRYFHKLLLHLLVQGAMKCILGSDAVPLLTHFFAQTVHLLSQPIQGVGNFLCKGDMAPSCMRESYCSERVCVCVSE